MSLERGYSVAIVKYTILRIIEVALLCATVVETLLVGGVFAHKDTITSEMTLNYYKTK